MSGLMFTALASSTGVIPAKAGISVFGGAKKTEVPAFAGMTPSVVEISERRHD